jgi:hypothetical protein
MSDSDIDKGSRGIEEISKALDSIEVGITCLTPENLSAPWLLFEAGALSKRIGERARLCTYLLGGLQNGDVPQPLGMFQHTVANKQETKKMVDSINRAINPEAPVNLDRLFERMWPDLEKDILNMPSPEKDVAPERPLREMVGEVLDMMRADADRRKKTEFMEKYVPLFQRLFPAIDAYVSQVMPQGTVVTPPAANVAVTNDPGEAQPSPNEKTSKD